MKVKHKLNKAASIVMAVILGVAAIGAAAYVYKSDQDQQHDAKVVSSVASQVVSDAVESNGDAVVDDTMDKALLRRVDFGHLKGENSDVESWLYVPDTGIDEVVMREPVVNQYKYDLRDWLGRRNSSGTFLFPAEDKDSDGNCVDDAHQLLLGHRMINWRGGDWQFSKLPTRWATAKGASDYPYVYLYYGDHSERWRVYAGVDAWDSDMIYDQPYEIGSDRYESLLTHVSGIARYTVGDMPDRYTRTLMLSTCNRPNGGALRRFVLVCVPDAQYYYDTKVYLDMKDKASYDAWTKGLEKSESKAKSELDKKATEDAKKALQDSATFSITNTSKVVDSKPQKVTAVSKPVANTDNHTSENNVIETVPKPSSSVKYNWKSNGTTQADIDNGNLVLYSPNYWAADIVTPIGKQIYSLSKGDIVVVDGVNV